MKTKTPELKHAALDWAVAKCEGMLWMYEDLTKPCYGTEYSTDWAQGGPIIENIAGFELKTWLESNSGQRCEAHIHNYEGDWISFGATPLEAAMRCYVASKLGDEVEIPDEIIIV